MDKVMETPVNLSEISGDLVLHVPMAGAEPDNIVVRFMENDEMTVESTPRGERAEPAKWYAREWRIGDYNRKIRLPYPVDAERVNVTYNNGVLTVTMPRGSRTAKRELRLTTRSSAYGGKVGHRGQSAGQ